MQFKKDNVCHGYGVIALADVPEGTIVCKIPKAAVLSVKTSPLADALEQESLSGALGMCVRVHMCISSPLPPPPPPTHPPARPFPPLLSLSLCA